MAPGSTEMSLQQEERLPEERETAWVLETGWYTERLGVGVEGGGPTEGGKGWTFLALAGFAGLQVAVLGKGAKEPLLAETVFAVLTEPSLVGVWLGVKEGYLLVLPYKPRP